MESYNPYRPPSADLTTQTDLDNSFDVFPRTSTWAVFGLTIITFSLYFYYWLYSRTQIINRNFPERRIAEGLMWATIAAAGTSFAIGFWTSFTAELSGSSLQVSLFGTLLSVAANVLVLLWIFTVRNRIHQLSGAPKGSKLYLSGIITFFFSVLYMNYKIRQIQNEPTQGYGGISPATATTY